MTAAYLILGLTFVVASTLLFIFGMNLLGFSALVLRRGDGRIGVRHSLDLRETDRAEWPRVTVQLPIYNEMYVSERVIEAACAIDYPPELLEIQVLDDSTDETTTIVANAVARAKAAGVTIVHLKRSERHGYKAGALADGLDVATGELVAIFDADFVPPADFLVRTVAHFADEQIAFVQARWGHLNRDFSWLTRLQTLAIDGHFLVEQAGRGLRGSWFNFNGTAGIWRAAAITDAGGWTADTLTEDLDLSYRAHLRGWRATYLEDLVVPGEVPAQMTSFRRQQHRWARGSIECAIRLLPEVWRADVKPTVKFQAALHLLAYGVHLLILLLTLIYPLVVLASVRVPAVTTMAGLGYLLALPSIAPAVFFLAGQRRAGRSLWRQVLRIIMMIAFGSGLMINTARAALQIATRPNPEFERTAKLGLGDVSGPDTIHWSEKRYQLGGLDRIVYAEAALGLYSFGTALLAYQQRTWGIFAFALLFGSGLAMVAVVTVAQTVAVHRSRGRRAVAARAELATWNDPERSPRALR